MDDEHAQTTKLSMNENNEYLVVTLAGFAGMDIYLQNLLKLPLSISLWFVHATHLLKFMILDLLKLHVLGTSSTFFDVEMLYGPCLFLT